MKIKYWDSKKQEEVEIETSEIWIDGVLFIEDLECVDINSDKCGAPGCICHSAPDDIEVQEDMKKQPLL